MEETGWEVICGAPVTTEVNGQVTVKEGYNNLPDHDASIDDTLDRRLVCINTLLE